MRSGVIYWVTYTQVCSATLSPMEISMRGWWGGTDGLISEDDNYTSALAPAASGGVMSAGSMSVMASERQEELLLPNWKGKRSEQMKEDEKEQTHLWCRGMLGIQLALRRIQKRTGSSKLLCYPPPQPTMSAVQHHACRRAGGEAAGVFLGGG